MSVNFAAVHERNLWRKHKIHQTLHAAIDGNDGAKNLLLRRGRVASMWEKYGDVRCVFVWEDDAEIAHAFRIDPKSSGVIQSAVVGIDQILRFQQNGGCSTKNIVECFGGYSLLTVEGIPDAPNSVSETPKLGTLFPDDLPQNAAHTEGLGKQILVNQFERSQEARNACIAYYGNTCQVCKLSFSDKYGELGAGFIHVHHLVPIASIGTEYSVDPISDLIPVCPNCHAMLHRRDPPLEIDELRRLLQDSKHCLQ